MQDREMCDADAEVLASCRRHSPLAAVKRSRADLQELPLKGLRRFNARHASPFNAAQSATLMPFTLAPTARLDWNLRLPPLTY